MIYSDIYSLYSDMIQDMMFVGLEALVLQSRVFLIFYLSSSLLSSPKRVLFEKKDFQGFHRNFLLSEFSDIFFVNSQSFFPKKMSTFKKKGRETQSGSRKPAKDRPSGSSSRHEQPATVTSSTIWQAIHTVLYSSTVYSNKFYSFSTVLHIH